MNLNDFNSAIKYGTQPAEESDLTFANAGGSLYLANGMPVYATVSVGSIALQAQAGVTILADSSVTNSRTFYMTDCKFLVTGEVWNVKNVVPTVFGLTDGSGGTFLSFGTALTTASAFIMSSGSLISRGSAFTNGTGGTAGKGVVMNVSGGTTFEGAQTIEVTMSGIIK